MYIGFQHKVCVAFCSCEPEAVTLVRHSMWPASPKNPTLAFHQDLLLWLESLVLEGCIGVDAFCLLQGQLRIQQSGGAQNSASITTTLNQTYNDHELK